ncbi:MAG TPA: potassium transporter Kup [Stellaceae bacterium]|nr:potassium transporter Kup [Stellaceae bacterium]
MSSVTTQPRADTVTAGAEPRGGTALHRLALGALGVVFGDIGTSPLYTAKQCFNALGGATPTAIYGVLSLIAWALMVVVTLKYVCVIMRADNRGEGGILALTALALRSAASGTRMHCWILAAGLLGAALFYGDGVITPAISVLSAIEGLDVATPLFDPYVIPLTLAILLGLFLVQYRGTARVGGCFGPVMIVWFSIIGLLGAAEIAKRPDILLALNPYYAARLLMLEPAKGMALLGAVVLCVTGVEALYADMGHFGKRSIRFVWLGFVFPALLLNYFGQGALLLHNPELRDNPFYHLVPDWGLLPMVVLASAATVIASQAVISGAFSMTRQAVLLGYLPRFEVRHTSEHEIGQIYVPKINLFLLVAVAALVIGFRTSDNLGTAYGIAVTGTMSLTTLLALIHAIAIVRWNRLVAVLVFGLFLCVDIAFFGANLLKIEEGGWFPLAVASAIFATMITWLRGREALLAKRWRDALPLDTFLATLRPDRPLRVPGTAVFMVSNDRIVPAPLLHTLKHNKVLHERVVLMKIDVEDIPHVADEQRIAIHDLGHNFHTVTVRYGFMDEPNLPRALAQLRRMQFRFNLLETSFFIGREKVVVAAGGTRGIRRWRKRLFIFLQRSMPSATEYFRIPSNRVVELGGQIEI